LFVGTPKAAEPSIEKEKLQKPLARAKSINRISTTQTEKAAKQENIERLPEGEFGRLKSEWEHGEVKKTTGSPVSPTVEQAEITSVKRVCTPNFSHRLSKIGI